MDADDRAQSVEEAGALLGATITRCGSKPHIETAAPKGMHSAFATLSDIPSSELLDRLYSLRAFLRSAPQNTALVAAPSLLAVLMKLLSVSRDLAVSASQQGDGFVMMRHRSEIPPMLSSPLRTLWVDCVVVCHRLGEDLTGNAKTSLYPFVRDMMALAGSHPRTGKAAGGTRIAAIEVIGGLFRDSKLSSKLAPWAVDVLHLCVRALKSSGNGEPTYRISAVRTACSVADASRKASLETRPQQGKARLFLRGALEDKAIVESVKLLKQGMTDRFPEVRSAAATFAAMLAPMLLLSNVRSPSSDGPSSTTSCLEDVMQLALKNIDDERTEVAAGWAEALSRCMSTSIEYGQRRNNSEATPRRDAEEEEPRISTTAGDSNESKRYSGKKLGIVGSCSSLKGAIGYLVKNFIKVGGELAAARSGGSFSLGGRAVRVGISVCLEKLLRLQLTLGSVGEQDQAMPMRNVLVLVLSMVGAETEKQLKLHESLDDATAMANSEAKPSSTSHLFGSGGKKSHADGGLIRLATSRVLRQGISEVSPEPIQLTILRELMNLTDDSPESNTEAEQDPRPPCTRHQLQVILIEISHLLTALGEAAAASIDDLSTILRKCLEHQDHGVRHEAAVACSALSSVFPAEGRKLLASSVEDIKVHLAQLTSVATTQEVKGTSDSKSALGRMFGRKSSTKESEKKDISRVHQYAIHGIAFMMSVVVRDLPRLPGGLPTELLSSVLSLGQELASYQFNTVLTQANPNAAFTCVRAGFGVICGVLTAGPRAVAPHISSIFGIWQKACKETSTGSENFTVDHDLICLDAVLSSVVAFLNYCSELLLSVPEALNQTSILLEEVLPLFLPDGRLGSKRSNPLAASRQQSAKSSLLEAFAWLPSGSFPMAADSVFALAAHQIRNAIESEVTCSILPTLVNREDMLLDAKSFCRAERVGQVGGARDLEESIIKRSAEVVHHGERESVFHLLGAHLPSCNEDEDIEFRGSRILGMFGFDGDDIKAPTPLHEVGTWRKPADPSCSSSVRLVDAAIQAFSATFGLKSGDEQEGAMGMLETLIPPMMAQLARTIGVNAALTEQDRRNKSKEDSASVANITAVLLSCLQGLPLNEASQSAPVGLGPPWMSKAKDLLLTVLPSASNIVRRAAAEGLALLSALGIKTEDAHFLQSTVLHSLDEVMHGNQPDGKPRPIPLEGALSAARSGALLTLACIQRTAQNVSQKQLERSRIRLPLDTTVQADDELPTMQMMTRILPSAASQGFRDYFVVRTHAVHAYGLLLAYSARWQSHSLNEEDLQLLRKAVELVENNFVEAWAAASADFDRGQEAEKLATEPAFLSVLLRLMTFLVPCLHRLEARSEVVACRFSCIATIILESMGTHPVVAMEGMAFFETLASNQKLLPPPLLTVVYTENPLFSCIPFILESVTPARPGLLVDEWWGRNKGCFTSPRGLKAFVRTVKLLSLSQVFIVEWSDMKVVPLLYSLLEATCTARCFAGSTLHRSLAAPRAAEMASIEFIAVEREISNVLRTLLALERTISESSNDMILRWILLSRLLLVNASGKVSLSEDQENAEYSRHGVIHNAQARAASDASIVFDFSGSVRWQVRCLSAQIITGAIEEMISSCRHRGLTFEKFPDFSFSVASTACAKECKEALSAGSKIPASYLVFHLEDIVSAASTSSVAAFDQAELQTLQGSGLLFLTKVVECFGCIPDPEQPGASILSQYATQLISSVKHALGSPEETDGGEASFRRYWAGCVALEMVVKKGLSNDVVALKRIIRLAAPTTSEIPFFEIKGGFPNTALLQGTNSGGNRRASLMPRIGKLSTVSKLVSLIPHISDDAAAAIKEVVENEFEIALHSAAIAMDGARLLLASGTSLCGVSDERKMKPDLLDSAYTYQSIDDIDDFVKSAMAKSWSACACYALVTLIKEMNSEKANNSESRKSASSEWMRYLVPLMFAGLYDSVYALGNPTTSNRDGPVWSEGLDEFGVATDCLRGLTVLIESRLYFENRWMEDIEEAILIILNSVLLPALDCSTSAESSGDTKIGSESFISDSQTAVIVESCRFLQTMAQSKPMMESNRGTAVLRAVLTLLDLLQRKTVQYGEVSVETIIATSLESASSLVSSSKGTDAIVKAMLDVALEVLSRRESTPNRVCESAQLLLRECLSNDAVKEAGRRRIAYELAKSGNWESWIIVCAIDDGMSAGASMKVLQDLLLTTNRHEQQSKAISALRKLVQKGPQLLISRIMNGVGAEVLSAFQTIGTSVGGEEASKAENAKDRRTSTCADCMKIILVSFQHLVSKESLLDGEMSAYLVIIFEHMISVVRYNGLPNHPSPQVGSDAALGRMSAQAILHICRTAPAPFKSSMLSLSDIDRTVLEFAVRGEMSGYATAASSQAPVKKKLNLKSFKK